MAWDSKYVKYQLAKVDGKSVKVYQDRFNCINVSIGETVNNALWSGNDLNVFLASGKVRRYRDQYNYLLI